MKNICVYASSSCAVDAKYKRAARELGKLMGENGFSLVFGGGAVGLMGELAKSLNAQNGHVVGVIPKALNIDGIAYPECDDLIVTETLRERKAVMDEKSDAFIALPGGFGTLEEILEIITLKQLKYHNKPVVIINTGGFYDALIRQFGRIVDEMFARKESLALYSVAETPKDAIAYIKNYKAKEIAVKWLTHVE